MISTSTYSDFYNHISAKANNTQIFYFIHLKDLNGNDYKYSNFTDHYDGYTPIRLVTVSTAVVRANLFEGIYSVSPLRVTLDNSPHYTATSATERFTKNFDTQEFETADCTIYLGYQGIQDDSGALFPFFKGKVNNFRYSFNLLEFDVVDRAFLELPPIPTQTLTQATYTNLNTELEGAPIPICYGRWDYLQENANRYTERGFIPAILIENRANESTPTVKLLVAGNELDAVRGVYIYDETLRAYGEVQDTTTTSLADATVEITLQTTTYDYLQAIFYKVANRLHDTSDTTNKLKAVDGRYDTECILSPPSGSIKVSSPDSEIIPRDLLYPVDISQTTNTETIGFEEVTIQVSVYPDGAANVTDQITIETEPAGFTDSIGSTDINLLTDDDTFDYESAPLAISYSRYYDGSTNIFQIQEADNGAGSGAGTAQNVQPEIGVYPTMSEFAVEIQNRLNELKNDGSLVNNYRVVYDKSINKFEITRTTGAKYFRIVSTGNALDIGFNSTTSYAQTSLTSIIETVLDIPDGDLTAVRVRVENDMISSSNDIYVRGVRFKLKRRYNSLTTEFQDPIFREQSGSPRRQFDPVNPSRTGRNGSIGVVRNEERYREIARQGASSAVTGYRFFVACDGLPDSGSSYHKKAPAIIESLLKDEIGIASGDIAPTAFTNANTDTQFSQAALYVSSLTDSRDTISNLARYAGGFFFVNQKGEYSMRVVKSSYSTSDVNLVVNYREIEGRLTDNFKVSRSSVYDLAKDIQLYFVYNYATGEFERQISNSSNSTLNLPRRIESCAYIQNESVANSFSIYLAGSGSSYGQFGELKTVVEFSTLHPKWLFAELGDVVSFSEAWDDVIDFFGDNPSTKYFIVMEKTYSYKWTQIKLLEVDTETVTIVPDGADLFGDLFFEDAAI